MYDERVRRVALGAMAVGESLSAISYRLGVNRATLRNWRDGPGPVHDPTACPRCSNGQLPDGPYAHLLGLYLGDGCLSKLKNDVYSLRIACNQATRG